MPIFLPNFDLWLIINQLLGILGKVGRFWAIGPRQYGSHATNSALRLYNEMMLAGLAHVHNRYGVMKNFSQRGYQGLRPMKFTAIYSSAFIVIMFCKPFYTDDPVTEDANDRLDYHINKIGRMGLPISTLNMRTSAHFLECNRIYSAEMLRRVNFSLK
jgi:hypothetical protein